MGLLGPLVEIEITDILSTPQKVLDWETRYEPYLADHRIEKPSTRLGDEAVFTGWDETMLLACEWRKPLDNLQCRQQLVLLQTLPLPNLYQQNLTCENCTSLVG